MKQQSLNIRKIILLLSFTILISNNAFTQNTKKADKYFKRAIEYHNNQEYDKAIEYYKKVIKIYPEADNPYHMIGMIKHEFEQYSQAISYYTLAIEKNSNYAGHYNSRAWTKCFTGDLSGAIIDINKAINLFTSETDASSKAAYIDTRATAFALQKKWDKSLIDFNEVIKFEPKALYYYKRGLIKKAKDDIDGAKFDFEKAKDLDNKMEYKISKDPLFKYLNDNLYENSLPPILVINDISFSEKVLDAEETAKLTLTIKNVGPGHAKDVYVKLSGYLQGLNFPAKTIFPKITANGGTETVVIYIKGSLELPTSEALITIEVIEPNFKVKIHGKQLKFPTREFLKPELILAQYAIIENQSANPNNQIDINEMIDFKFAVQNTGQGNAENVDIEVENNQNGVMLLGVVKGNQLIRQNPNFTEIKSGKFETIIYRYFVNSEFTDNQLKFTIKTNERVGKYGFSNLKVFPINNELEETGYIRTVATTDDNIQGKVIIDDIPDFVVDVDTDIPVTNTQQTNTYALIIGNEDYKSKQKGLRIEQNVDFAVNDAQIFAMYCEKTIGIPKKQIKYLKNATSAEINQGLAWINNLSRIEKGNAKLIFYYSGHGLPDELTKEAYIIPVDVSGTNIKYAIKVSDIYKGLTEHPAKQITVFLDACFSGGARNQGLISMKAVIIKPKKNAISGNIVVFASSTGTESSAVYREKQHGYFTYFLLKKLKDTKGNVNFEQLSNYIIQNVSKETGLNGKIQTPQLNTSSQIVSKWKTWKLK